jgi:hypothetical protein
VRFPLAVQLVRSQHVRGQSTGRARAAGCYLWYAPKSYSSSGTDCSAGLPNG